MSEGHTENHDTTLAPEADIKAGVIFGWGVAMFLGVLLSIAVLTGFFWKARAQEASLKVSQRSLVGTALTDLRKLETTQLTTFGKTADGRIHIPVEQAMELFIRERN